MHEPGSVRTANNTADRLQTAKEKKKERKKEKEKGRVREFTNEHFLIILPTHHYVVQSRLSFSSVEL